jgi:hypothetical protein
LIPIIRILTGGFKVPLDSASDNGLLGWVLAGVASMIATLSSLLVAGARAVIGDYREQIKELKAHADDCEQKHFDLNGKYSALEQQVCHLKDRVASMDSKGTKYAQDKERSE